jgi:hypothetical protein
LRPFAALCGVFAAGDDASVARESDINRFNLNENLA